jgi:bacterioferritin
MDAARNDLTPIATLRERARRQVLDGPVTQSYELDPQRVIGLLDDALATEWVCALRYKRHYYVAKGIQARFAAEEFLEHATQELGHADRIAERIVQLGGEPDLDPRTLADRSHAEYHAGTALAEMITEDLVAERIAIDSYREMVACSRRFSKSRRNTPTISSTCSRRSADPFRFEPRSSPCFSTPSSFSSSPSSRPCSASAASPPAPPASRRSFSSCS